MSLEMVKEKALLRSIAGGWGRRRNFSNFSVEEVSLFIKLQESGIATVTVDERGWQWASLTGKGETRLQVLNKNLPS